MPFTEGNGGHVVEHNILASHGRDVRRYGAVGDGVADDTQAFADAIEDCPVGGIVYVPGLTFLVDPDAIVIDKPMRLQGAGQYLARIKARPGSTGYMVTVQVGSIIQFGHQYGTTIDGLFLDGNGRQDGVGGLKMVGCDRFVVSDLRSAHFQRAALEIGNGVREGSFHNIYLRASGNDDEGQLNAVEGASLDEHNNLHFSSLFSVYPFGDCIRWDGAPEDNSRNIYMTNVMLHGLGDASPNADGYTYGGEVIESFSTRCLWVNQVKGFNISNVRFHLSGGGQPSVQVMPGTSVAISNSVFGSAGRLWSGAVVADADADTLTASDVGLFTQARIRFTTTGTLPAPLVVDTDYFVIRVDADTFKVATSLANASAGTAVNITDTGGGTHTAVSQRHHVAASGRLDMSNINFDGNAPDGRAHIIVDSGGTVRCAPTLRLKTTAIEGQTAPVVFDTPVEFTSTITGLPE